MNPTNIVNRTRPVRCQRTSPPHVKEARRDDLLQSAGHRIIIKWLLKLLQIPEVTEIPSFSKEAQSYLQGLIDGFSLSDALEVNKIEAVANHDFTHRITAKLFTLKGGVDFVELSSLVVDRGRWSLIALEVDGA
ncbi:unnamed protein product [Ilex paraguariensis]|uniref:Uncharacterized protein n=1 Tax=Ilex paraguariensis TaxID=185542 RepID=A0ABC8TKI3_9AQUA